MTARAIALAIAVPTFLCVAPSARAAGATVTVGHNRIEPAKVSIHKGESVTFHNVDEMPGGHTIVADDGSWQSPPLKKDESFTQKFDKPGTTMIHIQQHPTAKGEIDVQ
jgi:plastocyanin